MKKLSMCALSFLLFLIATLAAPSTTLASPVRRDPYLRITNVSFGTIIESQLPAPQISFGVDRTTINLGECAILYWNVENVNAVYLDGRGVVGHDSTRVCPSATTTYTLLVSAGSQDFVRQVAIFVASVGPAVYFYAENENISQGQCTTLRWGVANVDSFWLDGQRVYENPGARTICPSATTTYTFFATYGNQSITRQVIVYVSPATIPGPSSTLFNLINFHTQMCLEAGDQNTVVQASCTGSSNQLWRRVTWDYRSGQFVNVFSNMCLDATDIDIMQSDCRVSPIWYLTSYGRYYNVAAISHAMGHAAPVVEQGEYYQIRESTGNKCVDVDGWNHDNPGRTISWDCSSSDNDNQLWALR
jgi:hypothetical protein